MLRIINALKSEWKSPEGKTVINYTCIAADERNHTISDLRLWQDEDPTGCVLEAVPYSSRNKEEKKNVLKYKLTATKKA